MYRPARRALALAAAVVTVASLVAPAGAPAGAVDRQSDRHTSWAKAARATIKPGVMMYTAGAQCTANFVFTDSRGGVYLGYSAHCAGLGAATDTNGCKTRSLPLGTRVDFVRGGSLVSGGTRLGRGRLAYSSWKTERRLGTTDPATCEYNDFALVKVGPRHVRKVNPSVPFWGGPTGLPRTSRLPGGARVYSYGNSSLRGGLTTLSPKTGVALGDARSDRGWSHPVYTATPGIPGDSGSGFMNRNGRAVGTLSTVSAAPLPLSNNLGDLRRELTFAQRHSGIPGLRLTAGTVRFDPEL